MVIVIHSHINDKTIEANLGNPEYSYYFVLKAFKPVLEKLGTVVTVTEPENHVDAIYEFCKRVGEQCVFLSFAPPHRTPLDLICPTIPVFAWEFDKIPNETWCEDLRNDWTIVLHRLNVAITHSSYAVNATKTAMGSDFLIASLPAPVWDQFATDKAGGSAIKSFCLTLSGEFSDSWASESSDVLVAQNQVTPAKQLNASVALEFDFNEMPTVPPFEFLEHDPEQNSFELDISGVIYTSVFNPDDGRKNWQAMLLVFCSTFKNVEDAVLILKLTSIHILQHKHSVARLLKSQGELRCRIVVIYDYLSSDSYERLCVGSSYTLNASYCEGQCLPLMEYMSRGVPAVSPNHSAMYDYIHEDNAFIIECTPKPTFWPQDPRRKKTTQWFQFDSNSLKEKLLESYSIAKQEPMRYRNMADNAKETLKQHCSQPVVEQQLRVLLNQVLSIQN